VIIKAIIITKNAPEHCVQVKRSLISIFGNQARELENLSLDLQARFCMFFSTEIIEKTCPFREIAVIQKGRGQTGRWCYGKLFEKVGRELYSLLQLCLSQHNALHFMIAKFRAGELQLFKLSWGGF